ncbi:response regulator [Actinokineospora soli]|uniref:Response regulator n=1 Tax=Actinokineospora soli TaxID=1048753 RepID=A0ABW2TQP5_9PSEU
MTRIFLVDDHEIVRRGIADLFEDVPDFEVVGQAGSVAEALARVPTSRPDVAVLDVRLPDGSGVELCRELRSTLPDLRCLMLTSFADDEALLNAIMAGASGYVLKQVLGTDLVTAVRTVAAGASLLDSRTTTALLDRIRRDRADPDPVTMLTDQEHKVFTLIGEGLTNRQIGERLFLAEKTVKNYVSKVLSKLQIERRTQAAILASRLRRTTPPAE